MAPEETRITSGFFNAAERFVRRMSEAIIRTHRDEHSLRFDCAQKRLRRGRSRAVVSRDEHRRVRQVMRGQQSVFRLLGQIAGH